MQENLFLWSRSATSWIWQPYCTVIGTMPCCYCWLQPFNFSPVSFACNFQDWGCVILRGIDFLLKICWSIPCLHPSWKVHSWICSQCLLWCMNSWYLPTTVLHCYRYNALLLLLQPLRWHCVECAVHHERNVREDQHHYISGVNKQ